MASDKGSGGDQDWRHRFSEVIMPRLAGSDEDRTKTAALIGAAFDACYREGIREAAAFVADIGTRDQRIWEVSGLLADGLRKFEALHTNPSDTDRLVKAMEDLEQHRLSAGLRR
jgi:hypothetical protein